MLTAKQVEQAKYPSKPAKLFDGGGLYLHVQQSGKYWRYKYRLFGKENIFSIGVYPEMTLKQARLEHQLARSLVSEGVDPNIQKRQRKLGLSDASKNSFSAIADEWFSAHMKEKSQSYRVRSRRILDKDLSPFLGRRPIKDITPPELLSLLRKIEQRGAPDIAHRAKQLAGLIFQYAIATGRTDRNIARDLDGALIPRKKKHYAAITDPVRLGQLLRDIDNYYGSFVVRQALQLTVLLFPRPVELYQMEWAEIDFQKKLWVISAARMKSDRDHLVPLAPQVVEILESLYSLTSKSKYVFPSVRGYSRSMSENTVRQALRSMGYGNEEVTPHGFRATARTLLEEELNYPYDLIEHQLAHNVRDPLGRAYNRTTHLERRSEMMVKWAEYLESLRCIRVG
jgi:integrase